MGDVSSDYLNGVTKIEKYFRRAASENGELFNGSELERTLKINTSLVFFRKYPEGYDRLQDDHGAFGGEVTDMINGLRRIGWDDNIIYNSVIETRDVFLEKEGFCESVEDITKDQCVELYDFVVDSLGVYLKVGK